MSCRPPWQEKVTRRCRSLAGRRSSHLAAQRALEGVGQKGGVTRGPLTPRAAGRRRGHPGSSRDTLARSVIPRRGVPPLPSMKIPSARFVTLGWRLVSWKIRTADLCSPHSFLVRQNTTSSLVGNGGAGGAAGDADAHGPASADAQPALPGLAAPWNDAALPPRERRAVYQRGALPQALSPSPWAPSSELALPQMSDPLPPPSPLPHSALLCTRRCVRTLG